MNVQKLTKDKKIISKAIDVSTEWAKEAKLNLEIINPRHYLVLYKAAYTGI